MNFIKHNERGKNIRTYICDKIVIIAEIRAKMLEMKVRTQKDSIMQKSEEEKVTGT